MKEHECHRAGKGKENVNGKFKVHGVCTFKRMGVGAHTGCLECARR